MDKLEQLAGIAVRTDVDMKDIIAFGARLILNATASGADNFMAEFYGVELLPGEDLIAAMARLKGVDRQHLETYLRALAEGIGVRDAHILAQPLNGPTQ